MKFRESKLQKVLTGDVKQEVGKELNGIMELIPEFCFQGSFLFFKYK